MAYLDLGWQEYMVPVEYDSDHHRADPQHYRKDIRRMDWIVIRVVAGDHPADIVQQVRRALAARKSTVR